MGILPFMGQKKEEPAGGKSLDELKRLTIGADGDSIQKNQANPIQNQNSPTSPPKNQTPNPTTPSFTQKEETPKKNDSAFKEEQKIFTQISSIKELTKGEEYEVPKELIAPKSEYKLTSPTPSKTLDSQPKNIKLEDPKSQDNPLNANFTETKFKEAPKPQNFSQTTGTKSEDNSAFDKLLKLSSAKIEEKKADTTQKTTNPSRTDLNLNKASVLTNEFYKKTITPTQTPTPVFDGDNKKVSVTGASEVKIIPTKTDAKPLDALASINKTEEKKEAPTGPQKDVVFDWMKEETTEEPSFEDFPMEEDATNKINSLAEEENKLDGQVSAMRTPIDDLFDLLTKYRKIDTGEIANYTKMSPEIIEKLSKMFEEDGIIDIEYPTSLTKKPMLILKNEVVSKLNKIPTGEVLQKYTIEVDYVPAEISIIVNPDEARPVYALEMPSIGRYTKRFLNFIKDEVAENMPIELEEIVDPKKSKKLKERFFFELNSHLAKYFPNAPKELLNMLSGVLLHEMYGLGDIEIIMGDDMLEEVGINSAKTPITVYHRVHGWLKTNLMPGSEDEINNFSSQIGRKVGREITTLSPILDAHLLSGDRVNATLFPISAEGNTITIRRFARRPWTLVDFIGKAHTMNSEMAATLWLAMQYEMNIIIAGGTASGKTSTLNTLLALVPTYHRIISIEDVREIILPSYLDWNWIPMVTRSPNPEGLGEVTMLDLMVTSLRMRPDRIIVGEIRRKKEAEVLMEAIETGHSIYSTIHANSGYQVLRRLAEPPINIPLMQIELIDLIVVQYRDRKTNKRRTYEIAEIEQTSTGQGLQVNTVYKWVPRTDAWEKLNKPTKLITLLNVHTGLTEEDIYKEINERSEILEWMKRSNLTDLDEIGFVMKLFYSNPTRVKKMAKENTSAESIHTLMESTKEEDQAESAHGAS